MSLSLHSTERILIPEPQVTEHCKEQPLKCCKYKILYNARRTIGNLCMTPYLAPVFFYPIRAQSDVTVFYRRRLNSLVTSGTWLSISRFAINCPLSLTVTTGDWALKRTNENFKCKKACVKFKSSSGDEISCLLFSYSVSIEADLSLFGL